MFRTADAFGVGLVYLVGYTAHPPKPQIDKVALGAETWIPWSPAENLLSLVQTLKQEGVSVVALEKTSYSIPIAQYSPHSPTALLVGNEVSGVSDAVLAACDAVVHIPMLGKKESLNVSVAAGVALYVLRQKIGGG